MRKCAQARRPMWYTSSSEGYTASAVSCALKRGVEMSQVNESGVVVVDRGDMAKRVAEANERIGQRRDLRQGVVRDAMLVEPEAGLDGREAPVFTARKRESASLEGSVSFPS